MASEAIAGSQMVSRGGSCMFSTPLKPPSYILMPKICTKQFHTKQHISFHDRGCIDWVGHGETCLIKHYKAIFKVSMEGDSTAKEDMHIRASAKCHRSNIPKEKNPKRLGSSPSARVSLGYYHIIKYPLVTELAMCEMIKKNTLVFVVDKDADKMNIKEAAKMMFGVETKKVRTLIMPDGQKKAYLVLNSNHNALEIAKKIKAI